MQLRHPVLNALRQAALAALDGKRVACQRDENYEVSDLEALYAPDYGLNIDRLDVAADTDEPFRFDVPNLSTSLYYYSMICITGAVHKWNFARRCDGVIVTQCR